MLKKVLTTLGILIIGFITFYLFSEYNSSKNTDLTTAPEETIEKTTTKQSELLYTPLHDGKNAIKTVPATNVQPQEQTPEQTKINSELNKIQPSPIDFKTLNKKTCKKEIYKALLASYRTKRLSGFGSTLHCLGQVYKYKEEQIINFHKMCSAAAKHEPSYKFEGQTYDLSEENLIKNSQ